MSVSSTHNFNETEIYRLARLVTNRTLELIILPTEKCNFRCTYCYEDFVNGKMKSDTLKAVKELMKKRAAELDDLYISWFGGEPLLARDIVTEISSCARDLHRENPSLSYRAGMTTNGYLLDQPTFNALAELHVLDYQISLDGPRDVHDRSRIKAGGGKSFDVIWNNLLAIRTTDVPAQITLRVHFTADTLSDIELLIEKIRYEFFADPRFKVVFKSISRLGGPNDQQIHPLTPEDEEAAIQHLTQKLYGMDRTPEEESHVCYASRPNSLVIRADGRVGKCTVALNDARNTIGKLRPDGTLALDQRRIQPWLRGLPTLNAEVLACPLVGLPELSPALINLSHNDFPGTSA